MSYTRRFTKSFPVSTTTKVVTNDDVGKVLRLADNYYEDVEFVVTVDTDPFDDSVDDMKRDVDVLTGAVVATEEAQVLSIHENSRKIGNTIISGFFKTVKSDISQQIAELEIKNKSLLLQLNELSKRCHDKQRAMSVDYNRICSRYTQLFEDLNKELENRVHSLDEPVFTFARKADALGKEPDKMVAVPAVSAGENARVHAKIAAALAKKQALETIGKAHKFLDVQYRTDKLIKHVLHPAGKNGDIDAPVCIVDTVTGPGMITTNAYKSKPLEKVDPNYLIERTRGLNGQSVDKEKVEPYFNSEVASILNEGNPNQQHKERVANLTKQMFLNFINQK